MTLTTKRRGAVFAAAVAAALVVTACGSSATDSSPSAENPAPSQNADSGAAQPSDSQSDASQESDAPSDESPVSAAPSDEGLTLDGKVIGVAAVGTQHFWDREAFNGAVDEVKRLGGTPVTTDGNRDEAQNVQNHDVFLSKKVDAVLNILGDTSLDPKLKELKDAGIPEFGIDHASEYVENNSLSNSDLIGPPIADILGEYLGGKGKVAVFNAFSETLSFCGQRYDSWKKELNSKYPDIEILQPELAEQFANAPEDARKQTLTLLERYPEGTIDAIHVACWDQPAIGVVQAIEDAGRTDVAVTAVDAGPDTLKIMMEPNSPFIGNVAQQPRKIATIAAQNVARYLAGEKIEANTYVETFPVDGPAGAEEIYKKLGYDKVGS